MHSSYSDIFEILQLNVLEVKLKLLVFSFVPLVMRKVQKVESVNIQSDCETTSKKRTLCLHAAGKYEKVESVNTQNDNETTRKK